MRSRHSTSSLLLMLAALAAGCDRGNHKPRESTATVADEPAPDSDLPSPKVSDVPPAPLEMVDPLLLSTPLDPEREKWWMEKTARYLTGHEIAADDPQWAGISREDFVERMIAEAGFVDAALSFSLYFLGFREGTLRDSDGALKMDVLRFPHAVAAARAVAMGGDFMQLFHYEQSMYVLPLRKARLPGATQPQVPELPQAEIREQIRVKILASVDELLAYSRDPAFDRATVCSKIFPSENAGFMELLSAYGFDDDMQTAMSNSSQWLGGIDLWCFLEDQPNIDIEERFTAIQRNLPRLLALGDALLPELYSVRNVSDLRVIDAAAFGFDAPTNLTQEGFYFTHQNSSTNYNRKRGAYVLKRYFCDDLTPIALALPEQHAEDRHASDPGCQSCHYKLDPISGFFKDRGVVGTDFSKATSIFFDDLATLDKVEYQAPWRAAPDSGLTWNIGYVRSLDDQRLNSYGETLPDLFRIVAQAPEARQCLVRRVFEHLVGEEQVIDPGYLEYLTKKFEERMQASSSEAFKETVARIVLGNSFGEPDLVSSECYDRAPGTDAGLTAPCIVNFLLQKHCTMCHSTSSPAGSLDLSTWVELADGARSFPHRRDGQQLTKVATFQSLYERLSSTDRYSRMPLGKHMPAGERETMFLWTDDVLNQAGGN